MLTRIPLRLAPLHLRLFTTHFPHRQKPLPPRPVIPETDITESFLKGTGPGGQKINKTSSAVQLKHLPTGIVVKCQATRSREQNRKTARRLLGERLEERELGDQARTRVKEERERVRKASVRKKARRKYRKLEEGKGVEVSGGEGSGGEGVDGDEGSADGEDAAMEGEDEVGKRGQRDKAMEERPRPP